MNGSGGSPNPTASLFVDDVEVVSLLDGVEDLDGPSGESFPAVPPEAWPGIREAWPELMSARGTWRLHVRCVLIRSPQRLVLVDTGVGHLLSPAWFGSTGRVVERLASVGVAPQDVQMVVITHAHDDHYGGTMTEAHEPTFPNASYVMQGADLEWQRHYAETEEEDRVLWDTLLKPLVDAGAMQPVDGEAEVAPNVLLRPAPGHTPGHQVVVVRGQHMDLLASADTFNHPMQIGHPEWNGGSDDDPETATATRRSILASLAGRRTVLAPAHFGTGFGEIEQGPDGALWRPAERS